MIKECFAILALVKKYNIILIKVWYCCEPCRDRHFTTHQPNCKNMGLEELDLKKTERSKMGMIGKIN